MGKMIAVWGSPGSGKTSFSIKLAEALYNRSRGKCAVIVVFTDIVKSIAWYTNNSDVVSVNRKGLVCAKSKGQAKVYAMAQDGSDIAESCEIIVK